MIIASGKGTTAIFLSKLLGCRVVGVDLSEEMVRKARVTAEEERLSDRISFRRGDAERLPFNDQEFDVVISECSLCLFPTKKQALSEIYRVLKPGGTVAISDVTMDGTQEELQNVTLFASCVAGAESLKGLSFLLNEAGFQNIMTLDRSDVVHELYEKYKDTIKSFKSLSESLLCSFGDVKSAQLTESAKSLERLIQQRKLGYGIVLGKTKTVQ
ncbi:MAG: methyltransferase domain-containing protein [Candidatus Bathyarchaeota archaeon]